MNAPVQNARKDLSTLTLSSNPREHALVTRCFRDVSAGDYDNVQWGVIIEIVVRQDLETTEARDGSLLCRNGENSEKRSIVVPGNRQRLKGSSEVKNLDPIEHQDANGVGTTLAHSIPLLVLKRC
jgi:hypothetical protein